MNQLLWNYHFHGSLDAIYYELYTIPNLDNLMVNKYIIFSLIVIPKM